MLKQISHWSLVGQGGLLFACLALGWLASMPIALPLGGGAAVLAATIAFALCLVAGEVALAISSVFQRPQTAQLAMLLGMAVRMGVPLAGGVAIHLFSKPLADAGFLYYLLAFYPLMLAVETLLSLAHLRRSATPGANVSP